MSNNETLNDDKKQENLTEQQLNELGILNDSTESEYDEDELNILAIKATMESVGNMLKTLDSKITIYTERQQELKELKQRELELKQKEAEENESDTDRQARKILEIEKSVEELQKQFNSLSSNSDKELSSELSNQISEMNDKIEDIMLNASKEFDKYFRTAAEDIETFKAEISRGVDEQMKSYSDKMQDIQSSVEALHKEYQEDSENINFLLTRMAKKHKKTGRISTIGLLLSIIATTGLGYMIYIAIKSGFIAF